MKSSRPIVGGYRYEEGSRYWGEWNSKGQRHGTGALRLPDKSLLQSAFCEDLATGHGVLTFPDGAKYEGEILNGWFHGHGVFWRADGMKYEGEFKGGRVWGLGLVTFPDGNHGFPRHEGYFQDCKLMRGQRCPEVVQRAQKAAFMARIRIREEI
ncbi:MORN repeat-containing protein 4 homolog isoform X2 [Halyomorpha halys]|uniref:MORN repeat-containing protein 4 homolog isoform X2 n=1 Tax=Halyomorpha halys TaxID=286706 RepID=UPI0006D511D1|nr:MORN repeat-containing protein 4 homolog [Halyomorpha halys]